MTKLLTIMMSVVIAVSSGCGNDRTSNEITETAIAFYEAAASYDYETVREMSTEGLVEECRKWADNEESAAVDIFMLSNITDAKTPISAGKLNMEGETASLRLGCDRDVFAELTLVKGENGWLVDSFTAYWYDDVDKAG